MIKKVEGIIVPTVTPLTPRFELDEAAVERIFAHLEEHHVFPFILGTTGESASLPEKFKRHYISVAGRHRPQYSPLYAGISSNVLEDSINLAKHCFDCGVDAVAATLPTYYVLNTDQIKGYFLGLADSIPLPLIIYNIPATTHMSIPIDTIDELSHHPNIIATKDSERSEERLMKSLDRWREREDFFHILGWAAKSAVALIGGSAGLVPSTGNLMPGIYATMLTAIRSGDYKKAYEMQQYSDMYGDMYQAGRSLGESLWALKVLMAEKKLCEHFVMPPLGPQSTEEENNLKQSWKEKGI